MKINSPPSKKVEKVWYIKKVYGINVHTHPYCACVFLTDSKTISAIVYFSHKFQ